MGERIIGLFQIEAKDMEGILYRRNQLEPTSDYQMSGQDDGKKMNHRQRYRAARKAEFLARKRGEHHESFWYL